MSNKTKIFALIGVLICTILTFGIWRFVRENFYTSADDAVRHNLQELDKDSAKSGGAKGTNGAWVFP